MRKNKKIAIITKFSDYGGISKMMLNLAEGFANYEIKTDLVSAGGKITQEISNNYLRKINIDVKNQNLALPHLIKYISSELPDIIIATRPKSVNLAFLAHLISKGKNRRKFTIRLSSNITSMSYNKNIFNKKIKNLIIKRLYPEADVLLAVSEDVAIDIKQIINVNNNKLKVVPNPTITEKIDELSKHSIQHDWFRNKNQPIILSAGRFTERKDFETLIKAFYLIRMKRACKLVILGDGEKRVNYTTLAQKLNIINDIHLPGFTSNPYAYMAKSDVFAFTSTSAEGSPNVLKEALYLGTPVVSTDCPSGPQNILQHGKYGSLVPVKDYKKMANEIVKSIDNPPDPYFLKEAVLNYTIESSTKAYINALDI